MKFIHAADLHIDSPMRGLVEREDAPVDRLRAATRDALRNLVELALREQVDLLLLAGDIFDRDLGDFHAALFFRSQMTRLSQAGIRIFVAKGNHDAEGQLARRLPAVPSMHVFGSRTAEVVEIPELGIAVHGRSFPERWVEGDFVASYEQAKPGLFNIGVLHTSLTGRAGHASYAPTSIEALAAKGYDYFALGHVHAREIVRETGPRMVFPGNLQGRHAGETGPKGCELVVVDGQHIVSAEHVTLDTVRWHLLEVPCQEIANVDMLANCFRVQCVNTFAGLGDLLHAVRVRLTGETILHAVEAREPGALEAAIRAALQDMPQLEIWIESVEVDLRGLSDRTSLVTRQDPVGEVVRLVDALLADATQLREWVSQHQDGLPRLPGELPPTGIESLSDQALRALLSDAESTVLARLAIDGE